MLIGPAGVIFTIALPWLMLVIALDTGGHKHLGSMLVPGGLYNFPYFVSQKCVMNETARLYGLDG